MYPTSLNWKTIKFVRNFHLIRYPNVISKLLHQSRCSVVDFEVVDDIGQIFSFNQDKKKLEV